MQSCLSRHISRRFNLRRPLHGQIDLLRQPKPRRWAPEWAQLLHHSPIAAKIDMTAMGALLPG